MLEIKNVSKKFKDFYAVQDIHLKFENGIYGLLGANGAGKTTLMRMLCTLLKPSEGEILYEGVNIFEKEENYRKILGYLPQDFGYYPEFTAQDYLLYIASLKGLKPAYAKRRCQELLEVVSLSQVRKKKIKTFSGGMKRRLGIAQAVLNHPKILILDEPTAGLDPKERVRFRNLISTLSEDRIVLLSTHIVSDVENIANEILIMKDGRMEAIGTVEELTAMIQGKVWTCAVDHKEAAALECRFPICNRKVEGEQIRLQLIADQSPVPLAMNVEPTLEDVFLYYFGGIEA